VTAVARMRRRDDVATADTVQVSVARSRTVTEPLVFTPPVAPPAAESHPYPTARSRAVTRRFDQAEMAIARALADAALAAGTLADREHEVAS
jgi:hypothetical protein